MRWFVVGVVAATGVLLAACGPPPPDPSAPASATSTSGAPAPASAPAAPSATAPAPAPPPEAAEPAPASTASLPPPVDGEALTRLHGTVITADGKRHTGFLRWENAQAFWDDRIHGLKADRPYADRQPPEDRPHVQVKFVGFLPIGISSEGEAGRRIAARFGDIAEIRPIEGNKAEMTMKSGIKYRLDGGSGDLGATVHVDEASSGVLDLPWTSIERIVLEPAPAKSPPPKTSRVFGDVATGGGRFTGFIQWDGEECLSTDLLDGYTPEGTKASLPMGSLRALERNGDEGVRVETEDGRHLELRGTNDVNRSIRGIWVEDERYGRVRVSWDAFRRADLRPAPRPARRYEDYPPARWLRGTVTDRDGKHWPGRIVFDLDESETWETLDGERQGVVYTIPFERVRVIEPLADKTTRVTLTTGESLQLGDTQDVNDKNAGVLILTTPGPPAAGGPAAAAHAGAPRAAASPAAGGSAAGSVSAPAAEVEHYIAWKSVAKIDLE